MRRPRCLFRPVTTRLICSAFLSASLLPCFAWSQVLPQTGNAAWTDWRIELALRSAAVTSDPGSLVAMSTADCSALMPKYGACFAPNPASPYVVVAGLDYPIGDVDDRFRYRLRQDEAVVIIGQTPPEARYYGLQTYLFSRHETNLNNTNSTAPWFCDTDLIVACLGNRRYAIAGAIGPSLNHLEVSTGGGAADPFAQDVVFLITSNPQVESILRPHLAAMLIEAGASPNIINTQQVPCGGGICGPQGPNLGDAGSADDFFTTFRLGMTRSRTDEDDYIAAPPAEVFRIQVTITPPVQGFPLIPRAQPPDQNVSSEAPYADALGDLVDALDAALGGPGTCSRHSFISSNTLYYPCTASEGLLPPLEGSCAAPSEDAYYSFSGSRDVAPIAGGDTMWVAGVNHSRVASYSYSNLALVDADSFMSLTQATDIDYVDVMPPLPFLAGSLSYYETVLPGLTLTPTAAAVKDGLFLFSFDATCVDGTGAANPYCIVIDPADFSEGNMSLFERVYLHTGARTAGRAENFILSRLLSCP